ncbi:MAG TPA: GNAT family N-acetyltransferase, partial [Ktedonobacterales bacterium]|nr:GNAT family N-acetyltransferase [Ktedonobacterales bacterium]
RLRTPPAEHEAEVRAVLVKLLGEQDTALFVAETAGVVIGLAEVYLRADAADPATIAHRYGYVQSLMVTAQSRGRGAGAGLMVAAARWARERGADEMRLNTWELAGGPLAFYERLGYQTLRRTLVRRFSGEGEGENARER